MADKTADAVKYLLRLPKGLHKRLLQEAKRNNTSLNTEIVQRLDASLGTEDDFQSQLDRLEKEIKATRKIVEQAYTPLSALGSGKRKPPSEEPDQE
jgi:Arc-like DNA binding domain